MLIFHKENDKLLEFNSNKSKSNYEIEFLNFVNEFKYIACFFKLKEFPVGKSELHIIYEIYFINKNKEQIKYQLTIETNLADTLIKKLNETHLNIEPFHWKLSNNEIDYIFKIYNSKKF